MYLQDTACRGKEYDQGHMAHLNRYERQILLPEIGEAGQKKLKESHVLCIGSGGLGSPVLLYLAAAGVGRVGVMDPDFVSVSNLGRQILFKTGDEGTQKVQAAKAALLALNPEIRVVDYPEALTDRNAVPLLNEYDLVIDGSDNFATKFLINDAAMIVGIPIVYGSVSRYEGQVALFHGREGSCYRCLYPTTPSSPIQNCAESGVLGSIVGTIGTLQATLALQYLLSKDEPTHPLRPEFGKLTIFDFRGGWSMETIRVSKNPHCATCAAEPSSIRLEYSPEACRVIETLSHEKLQEFIENHSGPLLIDVRETEEWNQGHIPGARHWPLSMIERDQVPSGLDLDTAAPAILYCAGGVRSEKAARLLHTNRAMNCFSLQDGLRNWKGPFSIP